MNNLELVLASIPASPEGLKFRPTDAEDYYKLGNLFQQQGKLNVAIASYQQALTIQPDYAEVHSNLGSVFLQQGDLDAARASYEKALIINPDLAVAHNNLGNIFLQQSNLDAAVAAYRTALKIKPDLVEAHKNLGIALEAQLNLEGAVESYQKALEIQPDLVEAKFGICMSQLPIIYSLASEIDIARDNYQQHLQNLAKSYKLANSQELEKAVDAVGSFQPFYLPYQGRNDRELQQIYGEMIVNIMSSRYPQWSQNIALPKLNVSEKIRIGFVSKFFYNHSNWKIPLKGWIENLNRNEFEVFGYHTERIQDQETARAAKVFDKFTQGPLLIEQWCELIQKDNLHILIFPEFGMDLMTIKLGCLRLAPIQMTSWGHPNTSGLPTIDYYLSSEMMEVENAQEHYTEKLVKLPNLSIHYQPLAVPAKSITKKEIGIEDDDIMFWCCQSLFKYLPQHDDVFARIAQKLTKSKFVFIEAQQGEFVTNVFRQRLNHAFEEYGLKYEDYCIFLPRLNPSMFAGVTAIADVFLDSIGWSGCNSTLEAIAHNTPVVTLPGELMRGRHTLAILKTMGIEEMITATKEDYVKVAVRLGQDAKYRQHISQKVADNKHKLYCDLKPIRALEDFFLKVLNKSRRFSVTEELLKILQLAVQYQRANRLGEAEQLYRQILETQPNHPEALYGLGTLAQQQGQNQTAEELLSAAAQIQPDSVKIWFSLGNLHLAQQQYEAAVKAYRQALAIKPDLLPIYNNLGYARQQQGLFAEAINYYKKALELKPDFAEAEANLGNALHAQGQISAAEQLHYAQLNYQLGIARKKAGDLQTSVAYYKQAIILKPDFVEAHYQFGVALQAQGELEDAIACYQKALELNANYGEVYLSLGKIYQDKHNFKEAISAYIQGLKLINPHYAAAVVAYQGCDHSQEVQTTPPIPQEEVMVAAHHFPVIPPVAEDTGKRPFWSVVLPIYSTNSRNNYLLECLVSVLRQWTGKGEMEIVVVDDASPVPLKDLVNEIGRGIIQYYRNSQNRGAYRNFNTAVALGRGQWIHLLHDDDYVLPGFYDRLRQSLETCSSSVGAAFTGYQNINEQGKVVFTQQVYGANKGIAQDFIQRIGVGNPLNMPAVVVRRSTYEHLGGYLPELNYTGDWEFYQRITAFYDWWYEPEILAHYRQHSDNITTNSLLSGSKGTDLRRAIEVAQNYLPSEISAKSRHHHFAYCLADAVIPLKFGQISGALRLVQEALKIESSPESVAKLFAWLTQDEASPLRDEIVSKVFLEVG